jgi:hypothetical protein
MADLQKKVVSRLVGFYFAPGSDPIHWERMLGDIREIAYYIKLPNRAEQNKLVMLRALAKILIVACKITELDLDENGASHGVSTK